MVNFDTVYSSWQYDPTTNQIRRTKSNHVADAPFLLGQWVQLQTVPDIEKGRKVGLVTDKTNPLFGFRQTGNVTKITIDGEVDRWVPANEWIQVHS